MAMDRQRLKHRRDERRVRGRMATLVGVALAILTVSALGVAGWLVTRDRWPDWLQPHRRRGWLAVLALGLGAAALAVWQTLHQTNADTWHVGGTGPAPPPQPWCRRVR